MRALLIAALLLISAPALADGGLEGSIREEALRADVPAMAAITARGAKVVGVLGVEQLPRGAWMAELEVLTGKNLRVRIPVKLARDAPKQVGCSAVWRVIWAPEPAYIEAMISITSGALPAHTGIAPLWTSAGRLPALPVIATKARIITPFGSVNWDAGELPVNMPATARELAPPKALLTHMQRWFGDVLEGEPGAASLDLLAEGGLDWLSVQRILLGAGSQGAFVMHVITSGPDGLHAAPLMAPIFGSIPEPQRPHPLTITLLERVGAQVSVRVSHRGRVIGDQQTLLVADPDALAAALPALIAAALPEPKHLFIGAPGAMTLSEVLAWVAPLPGAVGVSPERVFVGFVKAK